MYPELKNQTIHTQRGSMLVIAIFIMVVMGLLVVGLSRLLQSSSAGVVAEVLGTRAFYAAQSGLDLRLQQLFPLDVVTARCNDTLSVFRFDAVQGLSRCEASVSCAQSESSENSGITHYLLKSTGSCENGLSQRTVEIEVWQ